MPITLSERVDSREHSGGSITFHYVLKGTSDDLTARSELLAATPLAYNYLIRDQKVVIEPEWVDTVSDTGRWNCTVRYNPGDRKKDDEPSEIGSVRITGSTRGGSQHVLVSLNTVNAFGAGASVSDNGNLIGVTKDNVEGVDIPVAVFNFRVKKVFPFNQLPNLTELFYLTPTTNNETFSVTDTVTGMSIVLNAGEGLFLGADFGEARADDAVEFVFDFAGLPNVSNFSFGGITGISKKGHEYMWPRYEQTVVGGLKVLGQMPKAVYVEQVLKEGDFSKLGL